jgi:hypothetical protein
MLGTLALALLASASAKTVRPPVTPTKVAPVTVPAAPPKECPAWGVKPDGCVEPPLKDEVTLTQNWDERIDSEQLAAGVIRGPRPLSSYRLTILRDQFPTSLRRGEAETSAIIDMRVVVGPGDSILDCQVLSMKGHEQLGQQKQVPLELDPALGETACHLLRQHGKFRHALNAAGQPVAAPIAMSIQFKRQRNERMLAPAPHPPVRWIGKRPYDRSSGWPPHSDFPRGFVVLQPPKWQDFVSGHKDLPKVAVVGLFLDFAKGGALTGCRIGRSSGNSVFDDASCRALAGAQNPVPVFGPISNYPIEVRWKKNKAELIYPAKPRPPGMLAAISIAETDLPHSDMPKEPVNVRIQVDSMGKVSSCRIDYGWQSSDPFDARSCALAVERGKFSRGIDQFGNEVEGGLLLSVDWQKRIIMHKPGYF